MPSQPIIFLLLFGGVQGLLFLVFLFNKKLYCHGYIFLLFYMGGILLQLTLKVMNKLWLMDNWGVLYSLSHYLPLLYGPLIWLFVKDIVERHSTVRSLFHFTLFAFILLVTVLNEYEMMPLRLGYVLYNPSIRLAILSGSLVTYHILALRILQKRKLSLHHYVSEVNRFQMNWLRRFVLLSFIILFQKVYLMADLLEN